MEVTHPFDSVVAVEELAKQNIYDVLVNGHIAVCRDRLKILAQIEQRARQMDLEEQQWKSTLPKHMQEVLTGKRILLWESLLKETGYQDLEVVNFMKQGVDLVGEHKPSPLFPTQMVRAATSPELLAKSSVWRNQSFAASPVHQDNPKMAQQLFDVPMDEVQRGFLKGPYMSLEDIKSEFGLPQVVVNRRFLLLQGETNKPRAIDDCKTSSLNNAYTQNNKLILQDLDNYVALAALAGSSVRGNDVRVQVADGNLAVGQLHPDFQGVVSWQGKCLDLEKHTDRCLCQVILWHIAWLWCIQWKGNLTSSHRRACRLVPAGKFLIQKLLKGVLTVFYDDFPLLEPAGSSSLFDSMLSKFLSILGWHHATTGKKGLSYAESFDVLGASEPFEDKFWRL